MKPEDYGSIYRVEREVWLLLMTISISSNPGYEMYYFTIVCGEVNQSLKMFFDPNHGMVRTIPGIKDMVGKFKWLKSESRFKRAEEGSLLF